MRLIALEVLGGRGLAIIAAVVVALAGRPVPIDEGPSLRRRATACDDEQLRELLRRGFDWVREERIVTLGRHVFPASKLPVSADEAILGLERLIEVQGTQLSDDDDVRAMEATLLLAMSIAPLCSDPDEDLALLRIALGKLALAGRVQRARDLAEQAFVGGQLPPRRARRAWFTFADCCQRLGDVRTALIAMACALAAKGEASWEQLWYESILVLRLFRDIGAVELARPLLDVARSAIARTGESPASRVRLETMELQLDLIDLHGVEARNGARLGDLIRRATINLEQVVVLEDELMPAVAVLGELLRLAADLHVAVPEAARDALQASLGRLRSRQRWFVELMSNPEPSVAQVLELAKQFEAARFSDDVAFDLRHLATVARRLLGTPAANDPAVAIYATELRSDQAIKLPAQPPTNPQPAGLRTSLNSALEAAQRIGVGDLAVVMLATAKNGLRRVVVKNDRVPAVAIEPISVFSEERLFEWTRNFPYGYASAANPNVFFTSTEGIGLSDLPERAVIVASTELQPYPPNLFRVEDELAGRSRRLAAVPSLAWLDAARSREFQSDGRSVAWIPTAEPDEEFPTLAVLAEALDESFARFGISVSTGSTPPKDLAGAELLIVAAHGGVAEEHRFFRVVQDDVQQRMGSTTFARWLANVGAVVLFVCSAGRVDKHPHAGTTIGLAKQLLDNGCRAVIAPPWPLEISVPRYWLPAFLGAWTSGAPVIDACYLANVAVRTNLADEPIKDLAMTVYGDPLFVRTSHSGHTASARLL
ncbi:MAG: hypothetical protein ACR2MQ_04965 [Gemmatimonadaceae bacterium]